MAQVFYDKAAVEVSVGGVTETLLASDCNINYSNSLQPLYVIGNKGSLGHVPGGPRVGDISFNFLTSITGKVHSYPGNVINYLASGLKHSIGSTGSGVLIKCAGMSGMGFLNSYAFNTASNSVSTSSASFSLFGGFDSAADSVISGRITGTDPAISNPGGTAVATGVAHGRYTDLTNLKTTISAPNAGTEVGTVYSADYSISFNHNPIYKVGQEFPTTTLYTNASESINVAEDVFNSGLTYTGDANDYLINLKGVDATEQTMEVKMISGHQVNTSATVGLDDIIRTQKTLTAAY
tara:strand:- start:139 stop:1020 length:882 start_codon:yes stop_codon:yes gene_type:complete